MTTRPGTVVALDGSRKPQRRAVYLQPSRCIVGEHLGLFINLRDYLMGSITEEWDWVEVFNTRGHCEDNQKGTRDGLIRPATR